MERMLICFFLLAWSAGIVRNIPLYPNQTVFTEIIKDITKFQECEAAKMNNETLRAPVDVQNECLLTAFSSFMNLTLLLEPASGQQDCAKYFFSRIRNVHRNMPHSIRDPKCPACMTYEDQPLEEFLKNFMSQVQRLYKRFSNIGRWHMTCK